jgi:hypothetical protein
MQLEIECGKFEKRNNKYKKQIQNKFNLPANDFSRHLQLVFGNCSSKHQNPKIDKKFQQIGCESLSTKRLPS